MRKVFKKFKCWGLLLLLLVVVTGFTVAATPSETQAATKTGFRTVNGKTYYIKKNGKKQKGWLELKGKKYYFNTRTGVQQKGWLKDSKGRYRYFTSKAGAMVTGWISNAKGQKRYFDPTTGFMKKGWMTKGAKKYYFYSGSGIAAAKVYLTDSKGVTRYFNSSGTMRRGWMKAKGGKRYYFQRSTDSTKDGAMTKGFLKLDGNYYYFYSGSGVMATGWVENAEKGYKYYFDPGNGVMYTGIKTVDGKKYVFADNGVCEGEYVPNPGTGTSTGTKTIKNYLLGALQPVGQALYVWGGGWTDSTRKGVSPLWKKWYNQQTKDYDYNDYRDLSTANRRKGLDCSGFVGWASYQVMHNTSGQGYGYTVVSGEVGPHYKNMGWGKIINQNYLSKHNWTLKPGDIGYNSGHTWIVLGQCKDKSVVIVHSTPQAGCQISGTSTPDGDYNSQAIALAKKYMSRYPGFSKYNYHTSSGNYIRNGNYLRWNRETLADPDGYMNKTADQILADLFK